LIENLNKTKKNHNLSKISKSKFSRHYYIEGYKFVLPAIIFMIFMTVFPSIYAIYVSLTNWTLASPKREIIWFENYIAFFRQPALKDILFSTIGFGLGVIASVIVIGMLLAVLLNQRSPFMGAFRATMIIPWTLTAIIAGVMWRWMLMPDLGIMNYYLGKFGMKVDWFGLPIAALFVLIIVESWRSNGYGGMFFLSSMQGIDKNLYEAARVDGASSIQSFIHITLPLLTPTMLVLIVLLTIRVLNLVVVILVVTGGGPFRKTETLALHMWKESFQYLNFGYAASVSVIILMINLVLVFVYMKLWLKEEI